MKIGRVVGASGARLVPLRIPQNVRLRLPVRDALVSPDSALALSWADGPGAGRYRVEIERVTALNAAGNDVGRSEWCRVQRRPGS